MRRGLVTAVCVTVLLSSCGTYTGSGAYTGSTLGSVLGSAIGGISNGARGSDVGTIVGMAGGAIVGGAIGANADKKRQADLEQYQRDKEERAYQRKQRRQRQNEQRDDRSSNYEQQGKANSGFDETNSGDDRLYDFEGSDYTGDYSAQQPTTHLPESSSVEKLAKGLSYTPAIEIRNARFVDDNQDNVISRGEVCKVIFEVYNRGTETLYDIQPTVVEMSGNKHLSISPSLHVEKIEPGEGIRYTAVIRANNKLKKGTVKICASVVQGNKAISKVCEFNIPTKK